MTISNQVENILRASRDARNSDRELLIIYMQKFGLDLSARQIELFRKMSSFETIRRIRQKLQEQGKYPADPAIKKERDHKSMVMQQASPAYKPRHIESVLDDKIILPWGKGR